MNHVRYSTLLERLIDYAGTIGPAKNAPLSAERFLLAVCDLISGAFTVDGAESSRESLTETFRRADADPEAIHDPLLAAVNGGQARRADGGYMEKKIGEATAAAQKEKCPEVTPERLLGCILADPTDVIRACCSGDPFAPLTNAGQTDAEREEKKRRFDALYSSAVKSLDRNVRRKPREELEESSQTVASLTQKVREVRDGLSDVIFGQDNAINTFALGYFQAQMRTAIDPENKRPAATFLFAGGPGVGKTYLAKTAAGLLGLPCMEFDMSEYADPQSYIDLIGFGDNYKAPKEGLLTGFVRDNPNCILLFDEIEKAHPNVIHLFLQVLDAGHLTDSKTHEEVSFNRALIIFTTNAGKALYNASDSGDFSDVSRKVILKALQKEVNPFSGQPFFPAAICSRFATGNVVLFNNMTAGSLCRIAQHEAERFIENFRSKYGISVSVSPDVYAALLFSEGGTADARAIRSRTERFFEDEMFELFRFISADGKSDDLGQLESIGIGITMPENADIAKYFVSSGKNGVVLFAPGDGGVSDAAEDGNIRVTVARHSGELESLLQKRETRFVIIDFSAVSGTDKEFLNIEDVSSQSRDAFWLIREKHPDVPLYVLQRKDRLLNAEERKSLLARGVRGFIEPDADGLLPAGTVREICTLLYQQASMRELAAANCLLTFETGQSVSDDGRSAQITLFDFEQTTAVDAEDTRNVLSGLEKPNVRFDDIIGAGNAKEELRFFIDYLRDPGRFAESGLRAPRGVLLYGPPGTGKTMLAKAMACEAGVTYLSAEGNQFITKYIGEGKDALHDLFAVARKYAPSILFIDEFEAIAKERAGGEHAAANGEDVLTALLTEMDGFHTDVTRPVFVLAATNFDIEPGSGKSLDRAILRRFDNRIYVDLPDKSERAQFIRMKIGTSRAFAVSDETIDNLVVRSTGMSLADLDSVFELSLRSAVRTAEHKVTDSVLDDAFETFIGGEERKWEISQLERVARHEAGHALLCWKSGETPSYVTIVARGDHGGYMRHDDNEGKAIYTKDELLALIRTSLGGRAAEIVCYGEKDGVSTGASGDLVSATATAREIICSYGMDDTFGLAASPRTGEMTPEVRGAINRILREQMQAAIDTVREDRAALDALTAALLAKNHLTGEEIAKIFRENT